MPSRNSIKIDSPDSYYHIYSRGVNKAPIFNSRLDYTVFLSLLKRYLSKDQQEDRDGKVYPHLYNEMELLAYSIMPTHFHLLIFQHNQSTMQKLMRGVMTSYSMYFNKKYKRTGPVFEGRYRASLITDETYLTHISRYIHLNPGEWRSYDYSSLPYYLNEYSAEWVRPSRIKQLFNSTTEYESFLSNYADYKNHQDFIRESLADS